MSDTDPGLPPVAAVAEEATEDTVTHRTDRAEDSTSPPSLRERLDAAMTRAADASAALTAAADPVPAPVPLPPDPDAPVAHTIEELHALDVAAQRAYAVYSDELRVRNELAVTLWPGLNEGQKSAWRAAVVEARREEIADA